MWTHKGPCRSLGQSQDVKPRREDLRTYSLAHEASSLWTEKRRGDSGWIFTLGERRYMCRCVALLPLPILTMIDVVNRHVDWNGIVSVLVFCWYWSDCGERGPSDAFCPVYRPLWTTDSDSPPLLLYSIMCSISIYYTFWRLIFLSHSATFGCQAADFVAPTSLTCPQSCYYYQILVQY
jgi:hypothetical protein